VKVVDGGFYTFELNKKLQEHRMGDVIDGTKIKEINVELN
ncbi:superantigen-like protein, partial [Staphylococcus aureus]|nr:superantigen-like protein [Staphylococcus aureus]